jgi:hypothetical protein
MAPPRETGGPEMKSTITPNHSFFSRRELRTVVAFAQVKPLSKGQGVAIFARNISMSLDRRLAKMQTKRTRSLQKEVYL